MISNKVGENKTPNNRINRTAKTAGDARRYKTNLINT
jgi:hypothetical protein